MDVPTIRMHTLIILGLMLFAAASSIQAQSGIVFRHDLAPTAEDRNSAPPHTDISFGAAVSISGRTAMIGMPNHNHAGRVGIYTRTDQGWLRTATLTGSNPVDSGFGISIDLDNDTAVIAARGAAYLFRKHGHDWLEIGRVAAAVTSVAYGRGIMAVGVAELPGTIHLYEHSNKAGGRKAALRLTAKLTASDAFPDDRFGASTAIERGVLVVGAPGPEPHSEDVVPGAAYVFTRSGQHWIEQQRLAGSDALPGGEFGRSVAIQNRAILVGAPRMNFPGEDCLETPEGNAYVFLPYRGTWFESQALNSPLNGATPFCGLFGWSVALGRGLAAVTTPVLDPFTGHNGAALAFDWVGQELRSGREVITTSVGDFIADLDFSGRWLIAGILNSRALAEFQIGRVVILEFAPE
jgi:hypothetical protein